MKIRVFTAIRTLKQNLHIEPSAWEGTEATQEVVEPLRKWEHGRRCHCLVPFDDESVAYHMTATFTSDDGVHEFVIDTWLGQPPVALSEADEFVDFIKEYICRESDDAALSAAALTALDDFQWTAWQSGDDGAFVRSRRDSTSPGESRVIPNDNVVF